MIIGWELDCVSEEPLTALSDRRWMLALRCFPLETCAGQRRRGSLLFGTAANRVCRRLSMSTDLHCHEILA
uniref:Uncharacterized protein n=1 Tax=Physcomitrium patens TaxID=3218 RepID=A0A2K1J8J5_PHYPA|nr:hypothetical protein PHYPA_020957 [Physcomitrium patens]